MPSQVRIIRERNSPKWDDLVRDVITGGQLRVEQTYFGITNPDRADRVRRGIRTAAKHQGHAGKVFYYDCPDAGRCPLGGPDCTHHVSFTLFTMDEARQEMAARAQQKREPRR